MSATEQQVRALGTQFLSIGAQDQMNMFIEDDEEVAAIYVYRYCYLSWKDGHISDEDFVSIAKTLDLDTGTLAALRQVATETLN